jgi:hypothetical protein
MLMTRGIAKDGDNGASMKSASNKKAKMDYPFLSNVT